MGLWSSTKWPERTKDCTLALPLIGKATLPRNQANWKSSVSSAFFLSFTREKAKNVMTLITICLRCWVPRKKALVGPYSELVMEKGQHSWTTTLGLYTFFCHCYIVPPTINKFTVGEHLRLGQRVSMLCSVTDGDLPLTLKWYRHDQLLLPEAQASGISVTNIGQYESVLRIDNLRPEHNANFTCVAENYAGISQHSQVLRVKGTATIIWKEIRYPHQHTTIL